MPVLEEIELQQERAPARSERILVVEMRMRRLRSIAAMLDGSGFDVSIASDAKTALSHLQDDPGCSLVLSDVMMPGATGSACSTLSAGTTRACPLSC